MSEPIESPAVDETPRYLIGVRLREPLLADDYQTTDADLHVGDFVLVETGGAPRVGGGGRAERRGPPVESDRRHPGGVRAPPPRRAARGGGGDVGPARTGW